ncbi:16S rRNA (guanine(527)-N(7))-methyltransferase RsmG, partial [Chloroflexota bacterium]
MERLINGAKRLGLELNPEQLQKFSIYYQELTNWNQRINLTSITDYEEVQVKHFLDALTVTMAIKESENQRIIDIGSGAGIPGLPLKILRPEIKLTLLDATQKKATFLKHITQTLGLNDIKIITGRAEEIAHAKEYRESFDIVLSRAVAPLPTLVELTLPFCNIGGISIAQKKGDIKQEISQATRVINIMGGYLNEIKKVKLEEFNDDRYLI